MAIRPTPQPAHRPAPRSSDRPAPRPSGRPEPSESHEPPGHGGSHESGQGPPRRPRPGTGPPKPAKGHPSGPERDVDGPPQRGRGGTEHPDRDSDGPDAHADGQGVAQAASAVDLAGSDYQQEIDVLRGNLDTLTVSGVWTDPTPPKFTGMYGRMLQDLEAGVKLRDSFATLNDAAAKVRNNQFNILRLVKEHKPPTFKPPKAK